MGATLFIVGSITIIYIIYIYIIYYILYILYIYIQLPYIYIYIYIYIIYIPIYLRANPQHQRGRRPSIPRLAGVDPPKIIMVHHHFPYFVDSWRYMGTDQNPLYHIWGNEDPFTSYVGVHQINKLLTHQILYPQFLQPGNIIN